MGFSYHLLSSAIMIILINIVVSISPPLEVTASISFVSCIKVTYSIAHSASTSHFTEAHSNNDSTKNDSTHHDYAPLKYIVDESLVCIWSRAICSENVPSLRCGSCGNESCFHDPRAE